MKTNLTEIELSISSINSLALSGEPFTMEQVDKEIKRRFILVGMSLVFLIPMKNYIDTLVDQGLLIKNRLETANNNVDFYSASEPLKLLAEFADDYEDGQRLDTLAMRLQYKDATQKK